MPPIKTILFLFFYVQCLSALSQPLPIKGKWNVNDTRDYVGVWEDSISQAFLDATNSGHVSGITAILGKPGDVPLTLDFAGDEREEFAIYRQSDNALIFFYDFTDTSKVAAIRHVCLEEDLVITGDWDNNGKDGFAIYRPSTRQFFFYQNFDSSRPFFTTIQGNQHDIPIAGNWDGIEGDGFALYRPATRQIFFFQNYNSVEPFANVKSGNSGDKIMAGDWDGNGTDEYCLFRKLPNDDHYEYWFTKEYNTQPDQLTRWSIQKVFDISNGRKVFYTNKVPHVDHNGNYRTAFNEDSFLPKGIYNADPQNFDDIYKAGYNLAFLWPTYYPLSESTKASLDSTDHQLKTILYFVTPGGIPFTGRFTGKGDLVGICSNDNSRIFYIDSNDDNRPDKTFDFGDLNDVGVTGDWDGDGKDEFALFQSSTGRIVFINDVKNPQILKIVKTGLAGDVFISGNWDGQFGDGYALYRASTKEILFYQNYNDQQPFAKANIAGTGVKIINGDWNGDGKDGYALYKTSTHEFSFYQNFNSSKAFIKKTFGKDGDTPVGGDWNNDGIDGYGIYRVDKMHTRHTFLTIDDVNTPEVTRSLTFGNPLLEAANRKYIFGIYTADEPFNQPSLEQTYAKLSSIYQAYSHLSSQVFFHTDLPYPAHETDEKISMWNNFTSLGEANAHDDYPIVNANTPQAITSLNSIARTVEQTRLQTQENSPNWFVPQAFEELNGSFKFYKPAKGQYKAMVYTSVVHGATGILTFTYNNSLFPNIHGISPTSFPDLWEECKGVNHELDSLKSYILSNTVPNNYTIQSFNAPVYDDAPIRTVLKYHNGYYVLMAVNITKQRFNTLIQLSNTLAPSDGIVEKLFEDSFVTTTANAIHDSFNAFDVHIYKFKAPEAFVTEPVKIMRDFALVKTPEPKSVQLYPNPFFKNITFEIRSVNPSVITIRIYNASGQIVHTLKGEMNQSDVMMLNWDGTSTNGEKMPDGMYLYTIFGDSDLLDNGKFILTN